MNPDDVADLAAQDAARASAAGGLVVREIDDLAGLRAVGALLDSIWSAPRASAVLPVEVLRMLAFTGSYVAGAFVRDELVGAAVGVLGLHDRTIDLHSHVAGVAAGARSRQVGYSLKLHQRAWALRRGISTVSWTFDPLVRRNAVFNLHKLGATVERYLVDFYGDMPDAINAGHGSDRLLVRWHLAEPSVVARAGGDWPALHQPPAATIVLDPALHGQEPSDETLLCAIPEDIESLRRTAPAEALEWREALRAALTGALDAGYRITGVLPTGWYVLRSTERAASRGGR